jgi:hypothetical protein
VKTVLFRGLDDMEVCEMEGAAHDSKAIYS